MDQLNIKKAELEQEIETLENDLNVLKGKHKSQATVFDNLTAKIEDLSACISALDSEIDKKNKELSNLNDTIQSDTTKRSEIAKEISFLEKTVNSMNKTITTLKNEIQELEALSKQTSETYESEKKRLFNIGEREKTLDQREAFIKERYAEAGIAY